MGPTVEAKLERPGFYPAGGGRFSVNVAPTHSLEPITILERGVLSGFSVNSLRLLWATDNFAAGDRVEYNRGADQFPERRGVLSLPSQGTAAPRHGD